MYYALIDMRSDCEATTALARGSLKEISDSLIYESKLIFESFGNLQLEEFEEEYYCEFDDYKSLSTCDDPTEEMIKSFSFTLDDCTISVGCLVEGYSELVKAWDVYKSDKWSLDCWSLVPEIEETEENLSQLDEEMRSLNDDFCNDDYIFS